MKLWKILEKIIWGGTMKDLPKNGSENTETNFQDTSSYDIKVKTIHKIVIKNNKDEK